ncbi:MAG TPA: DinB family protein [Bryobacteraceae bacterium]|nr:DinB family protein [Bryobacteraceae bacterium]
MEQVLNSWKTVRGDTINAVNDFPAGEFDYRNTPDVMTFGELARHILDAGDGLTGLLLDGEENFNTPNFREKLAPHRRFVREGRDGLVAALQESIEQRTEALAGKSADFYAQVITGRDGRALTRLEMLLFVKEHELTHRAQLFISLRMKGIVPPTTRRRLAQASSR